MPNWTYNTVVFEGNEKQLKTLKTMLKSKDNEFDFNNIIPMPKNIFRGNLGLKEEEKYGKKFMIENADLGALLRPHVTAWMQTQEGTVDD